VEQSNNKNPGDEPEQDREGEAHKPAAGDPAGATGAAGTAAAGNESAPVSEASDANDAMKNLPVVEAPSIDAAKADEAAAEPVGALPQPQAVEPLATIVREAADENPEHARPIGFAPAQPRSVRFALLAATIALVAGLGSFVGGLAAWGVGHHDVADTAEPRGAEARNVLQALNKQIAELNALKASLDTANRSTGTQFAKITDRLTSLEHAQAEPAAKLTRVADAVDRLEKHAGAAPEITGSISRPAQPQPAAVAAAAASEHVLNDWIVRDVRNGRALVESRYGGLFVAAAGGNLPGLGRVESVRRQDGNWIVVTAKGTITSDR
jgi:hypothetical protein